MKSILLPTEQSSYNVQNMVIHEKCLPNQVFMMSIYNKFKRCWTSCDKLGMANLQTDENIIWKHPKPHWQESNFCYLCFYSLPHFINSFSVIYHGNVLLFLSSCFHFSVTLAYHLHSWSLCIPWVIAVILSTPSIPCWSKVTFHHLFGNQTHQQQDHMRKVTNFWRKILLGCVVCGFDKEMIYLWHGNQKVTICTMICHYCVEFQSWWKEEADLIQKDWN